MCEACSRYQPLAEAVYRQVVLCKSGAQWRNRTPGILRVKKALYRTELTAQGTCYEIIVLSECGLRNPASALGLDGGIRTRDPLVGNEPFCR